MTAQVSHQEIQELVANKDWRKLKECLKDIPAVDIAEMLEDMEPEVAVVIFRLLVKPKAADVFSELSTSVGLELLSVFSTKQLSDVMDNLEPDEQVAFMEELPGHLTLHVMSLMKPEDREQVQKLLGYPEESVGRLMTTKFVRVKSDWTIERSMAHIRVFGKQVETLNVIYVVDENGKLIDDLRINHFLLADPQIKVAEIMDHTFQALSAFDDQEEAVKMMSKYGRVALPVVDSDGVLVGIVTVDDVMEVAEEEATEDMHLMGGMTALDGYYSETGVLEMVRRRVGWLVILFLGQMLTVTALANFEDALAAAAILAFFIPMIISSGGNSGSQAATLIIRALSTGDIEMSEWKTVLGRELLSGLLLGSIVGIMGSMVIAFWMTTRGEPLSVFLALQALTVGTSLVGVIIFGNLCGSMLPFLMSKLGLDPAVTSAPFVATLVDVTGIIIYFSVATLLLKGVVL
jgi:magnesium transporter